MTQPTTVDMTFDTSLIDLAQEPEHGLSLNTQTSFSTTESDTSRAGQQNLSPAPKTSGPIQHLPTEDAYDAWASVYDTDGNMLQAIDDLELETLLSEFLDRVVSASISSSTPTSISTPRDPSTEKQDISIIDLGCGTGRNTAKLIQYAWPADQKIHITGMDVSKGMLGVARTKLKALLDKPNMKENNKNITLHLQQRNCFPLDTSTALLPVSALLSSLVLEHIPLPTFFSTLTSLLQPRGHALITNMHSDMGRISQAGFINAQGVKVRPESFAHTLKETVDMAVRSGFEVLGTWERAVERGDVESERVSGRGEKWVGVKVWYGVLLRKG